MTRESSTASWAPRHRVNPSATTSSLRLSNALKSARSMSLTNMFVMTRTPASRQTCAATHSKRYTLFPNTPASAHTARWWPNLSSRRPQRQVRRIKGRGRWSLRHHKRRNVVHQSVWPETGAELSMEGGQKTVLGTKQSLRGISQTRPHLLAHELLLQLPSGLLLPPKLWLVGLRVSLPHGGTPPIPSKKGG